MLSVIHSEHHIKPFMLSAIILNFVMLSGIMLNGMAPSLEGST
jgi:hypothetical protein